MINKFYAVCLLVHNFEKSLAFYRDMLGLALNSQDSKYADFKLGESLLGIFQKDEAIVMFPAGHMGTGGGAVYAFEVDDMEASVKDLDSKGVAIFEGPKSTPWGQRVAYFKDPDDHIWELTQAVL